MRLNVNSDNPPADFALIMEIPREIFKVDASLNYPAIIHYGKYSIRSSEHVDKNLNLFSTQNQA